MKHAWFCSKSLLKLKAKQRNIIDGKQRQVSIEDNIININRLVNEDQDFKF